LININTTIVQSNKTPHLDFKAINEKYNTSKSRLIFLDYDGTLTPIVRLPQDAIPSIKMLEALKEIVQDKHNLVFIISGRDQLFLDQYFGTFHNLGLSAEHGSFIKYPNGEWINLAEEIEIGWKKDVTDVFDYYTERTSGSFVEHKRYSITWHYRLSDPEYGTFQANECRLHLEQSVLSKVPVDVMVGKKNLEVRPTSMNKGEIVRSIVQKTLSCDFVFCAGDDRTDEDMFQVLTQSNIDNGNVFTCTIGGSNKMTKAMAHVVDPFELIELLRLFAFSSTEVYK
jgi:trehalose 6-phosphate synthase/phosphatase